MTRLYLVIGPGQGEAFLQLFRAGVGVAVRAGCSLKDLLCGQFQLDESYVESRISTIFLDGKPVDAVGSVRIREGSTLALSAAMPGLAGAILRRGGALAPLRTNIPREDVERSSAPERDGVITVKLFNLLTRELAPAFLRRGVLLPAAEAEVFFRERDDAFWGGCLAILLDGERIGPETLTRGGWSTGAFAVALSVETVEG